MRLGHTSPKGDDLGLLWVEDNEVVIAPELKGTEYEALAGQPIRLPEKKQHHPNPAHLASHAQLARQRRG